jgi:hypothetical protein
VGDCQIQGVQPTFLFLDINVLVVVDQALMSAVTRIRKIESSWVKGHSGVLLSEWADMLATKGVMNEQPPASV